jgi:hypothetical protein
MEKFQGSWCVGLFLFVALPGCGANAEGSNDGIAITSSIDETKALNKLTAKERTELCEVTSEYFLKTVAWTDYCSFIGLQLVSFSVDAGEADIDLCESFHADCDGGAEAFYEEDCSAGEPFPLVCDAKVDDFLLCSQASLDFQASLYAEFTIPKCSDIPEYLMSDDGSRLIDTLADFDLATLPECKNLDPACLEFFATRKNPE